MVLGNQLTKTKKSAQKEKITIEQLAEIAQNKILIVMCLVIISKNNQLY